MADIQQDHGDGGKGKPKKMAIHIDFTPMVDLGFLLITFFMLATSMIKPQTMEIALPSKDKVDIKDQPPIKESRAVTILMGKEDRLFYYEGGAKGEADPKVVTSNYSPTGLRKYLIGRNGEVMMKIRALKDKKRNNQLSEKAYADARMEVFTKDHTAPIVIIKATDGASYKNLVDILDEMAICNIAQYAIVDITPYDLKLISDLNK